MVALALSAAVAPSNAPAAQGPPTFVIDGEPNSLDTIRNTPFGWLLGPLTQGYLFLVDDRGRLVSDRALRVPTRENGLISADGRTVTYEIRTGRWSDGARFDARDVGADDPFAILPRHIAAAFGSLDRSSLDEHPIGLGPYRLLDWQRGQRLEFERNPFAWRAARSPRVVVEIQPAAQTRLVLTLAGELDAIALTGLQSTRRARPASRCGRRRPTWSTTSRSTSVTRRSPTPESGARGDRPHAASENRVPLRIARPVTASDTIRRSRPHGVSRATIRPPLRASWLRSA
jgi:ABC-type transport system substrate-binding protein